MNRDAELVFRRELEKAGEASVRADFYSGGGLSTGGEDRREIIRVWLREQELRRENREDRTERYVRFTLWIAASALLASVAGVIATIVHK